MLAGCEHTVIGVDVESVDRKVEWTWFEPIWSPAEWRRLSTADNTPESLLRLRVRKEAGVKALGVDLSVPLSNVATPVSDQAGHKGMRLWLRQESKVRCWQLYDLPTKAGFVESIVTYRPIAPEHLRETYICHETMNGDNTSSASASAKPAKPRGVELATC